MPHVLVPAERWPRWRENFERGHGPTQLAVRDGALAGVAEDGSTFLARPPFDRTWLDPHGEPDLAPPASWGLLLVRKGGFAVARMAGARFGESKVGRRHVQGRTKAGGQSQQRFARRRDNQARQAYEAAAEHAARILTGLTGPLVTGGDHAAVDEVLADPRLRHLDVVGPWLAVADPRRAVLEQAARDAASVQVDVVNAPKA